MHLQPDAARKNTSSFRRVSIGSRETGRRKKKKNSTENNRIVVTRQIIMVIIIYGRGEN